MLPLHTDACVNCVTKETSFIEPSRLVDGDGVQTHYAYKCPDCGYEWQAVKMNTDPELPEGHPQRRPSAQ